MLANSRAFDALGVVPHRVVDIPGADGKPALQLGVTAVHETSPEAIKSLGPLEPTTSAAKREVAAMRAAGADVVIVLVHGTRAAAVEVAEGVPGADIVVTGIPEGTEKARLGAPATRVGHGWVLEPGDQAQTLTRVRLSIDPRRSPRYPGRTRGRSSRRPPRRPRSSSGSTRDWPSSAPIRPPTPGTSRGSSRSARRWRRRWPATRPPRARWPSRSSSRRSRASCRSTRPAPRRCAATTRGWRRRTSSGSRA
ncbi:hypothetical protein [Nannocystis pusilla]|uniref:hypothetical protein n=1 Tax=Nannocystis pusilla TaxID=889268 RepID=UPI003B803976